MPAATARTQGVSLTGPAPPQFVVDTGTSIIVGPTNRVQPLLDAVNKSGPPAAREPGAS